MKKLLGILVLAFILNSCATPDDTYSSLLNEPHNALAKSSNGTFGMSWKRKNIEHAVFSALATCDNYGTGCVLEKINGSRVTPQEATEWRNNFNRNKKYLTIGSGVRGTFVITSDTGERDKESKKDNPAEERNKLLISCFKDNRETSIKLKITECEAYADGEAVDIGDDSGNPNEFSEMSKKNENLKKKEEKYFDDNRYFKCYGEMTNAHKARGFHQSNRETSIRVKETVCKAYAKGEELNYEGKR